MGPRKAQMVLDIKSVFMLLHRRFNGTNVSDPTNLAKEMTLKFLETFFAIYYGETIGYKKPPVTVVGLPTKIAARIYLASSANNMELGIPLMAREGDVDADMMDNIQQDCLKCYYPIRDAINKM